MTPGDLTGGDGSDETPDDRRAAAGAYDRGVEAGRLAQTVQQLTAHQVTVNGSIERTGTALTMLTTELHQLRYERDRADRLRTWAIPAIAGIVGGLPAWLVLVFANVHHL